MVVPVRGYHFLFAFEEAGIWEELALASDGSLPRVDRSSDQPARIPSLRATAAESNK